MPLSMTGFGEAHCRREGLALALSVEVRTINSRYFKIGIRIADGYGALEPQIESILRRRVRRGSIQVSIRVDRARPAEGYRINKEVLNGYRQQIEAMHREWHISQPVSLESLLLLPGVVDEGCAGPDSAAEDWPAIRETLEAAIDNMDRMRLEEGRAMAADLEANARAAAACLDVIQQRGPLVVEGYRARLEERLRKTLAEFQIALDPSDLFKELSLYGERIDISEEIVRLRSHLEQFRGLLDLPECSGRKLEFLTQEMFREANTIGSKANDVEISRQVIEIKAAVERIREMIQNVE